MTRNKNREGDFFSDFSIIKEVYIRRKIGRPVSFYLRKNQVWLLRRLSICFCTANIFICFLTEAAK